MKFTSRLHRQKNNPEKIVLFLIIGLLMITLFLFNYGDLTRQSQSAFPPLLWGYETSSSASKEICNDGVDNDADSLTDCEDVDDCSTSVSCVENCSNGLDDDGDFAVDCNDSSCEGDPACI